MKSLITLSALYLMFAATSAFSAEYKMFYTMNGKVVDAETAIIASIKGSDVFKCQSVHAELSKAKTSIGLKNVKKPKNTK